MSDPQKKSNLPESEYSKLDVAELLIILQASSKATEALLQKVMPILHKTINDLLGKNSPKRKKAYEIGVEIALECIKNGNPTYGDQFYGYVKKCLRKDLHKKLKQAEYDNKHLVGIPKAEIKRIDSLKEKIHEVTSSLQKGNYTSLDNQISGLFEEMSSVRKRTKIEHLKRVVQDWYLIIDAATQKGDFEKLTEHLSDLNKSLIIPLSQKLIGGPQGNKQSPSAPGPSIPSDPIRDTKLWRAMLKLTPQQMVVIVLNYMIEPRVSIVPRVLEVSESRVSQIKEDALQELKKQLKTLDSEET